MFEKHMQWALEKVKGNYGDEVLKFKLSVSRNRGLWQLSLLLNTRDSTTTKTVLLFHPLVLEWWINK